jgi:hypothetical protein
MAGKDREWAWQNQHDSLTRLSGLTASLTHFLLLTTLTHSTLSGLTQLKQLT